MCLTASDEARQGPPKQCNQGKSKERQPANSAAKQTVQRCKSGSAEARSVQERKRQQCMSEDKTSDRQRKSSVRRYMLQVTSTAIIKECCAFKYCTDRMLREAPAEIEGLRTLDDSQKSSNRMKLGVVSASMYACSTGRDVPAKKPVEGVFRTLANTGAGASLEGCWQTLHACALGAKRPLGPGSRTSKVDFTLAKKMFAGFCSDLPSTCEVAFKPAKNVARIFVDPCLCSNGFVSGPACL